MLRVIAGFLAFFSLMVSMPDAFAARHCGGLKYGSAAYYACESLKLQEQVEEERKKKEDLENFYRRVNQFLESEKKREYLESLEKESVTQTISTTPAAGQPANPRVLIETSKGNITVEVFPGKAPQSAANFLGYVKNGFYDGLIFHRVIPGFIIQGGGMIASMAEKPKGAPIQNEADNGLKNLRGTLAMARTSDPHSASSQFFINVADNVFLNHRGKAPQGWGYAVFGQVVDGMDVVDAIVAVPRGNRGPHGNVPVEPIVMQRVTLPLPADQP